MVARKGAQEANRPDPTNPYIKERGGQYVIVQKGTGKVLSRHASLAKAKASFAAMEAHKYGS